MRLWTRFFTHLRCQTFRRKLAVLYHPPRRTYPVQSTAFRKAFPDRHASTHNKHTSCFCSFCFEILEYCVLFQTLCRMNSLLRFPISRTHNCRKYQQWWSHVLLTLGHLLREMPPFSWNYQHNQIHPTEAIASSWGFPRTFPLFSASYSHYSEILCVPCCISRTRENGWCVRECSKPPHREWLKK